MEQTALALALGAAQIGTWIYTPADHTWVLDPRAQRLHGLSNRTLPLDDESLARQIHRGDIPGLQEVMRDACRPASSGRCEFKYRVLQQADGGWRWIHIWGQAEFEGIGPARRAARVHGACQDISVQVEMERQLKAAQERVEPASTGSSVGERPRAREDEIRRYELLAYHSRDIVLCIDSRDGRILEANTAALKAYGYSREELLQLTIQDLRAADTRNLTSDQMVVAGANGLLFETQHRRRDGTFFPVEVSSQGAPVGTSHSLISIVRDITERRQVERALRENQLRLEAVFAAIPDLILEYDAGGRPVRANQTTLDTAGFESLDFTRDQALARLRFRHLDGSPVKVENLPTSRAFAGETVSGELYAISAADGGERIVSSFAAPLHSEGKLSGVVALWHDVTDLKRAEDALRRSEERLRKHAEDLEKTVQERTAKLEETIADLKQFSYSLAHDMRAPLRSMSSFAALVLEDSGPKLDPENVDYLRRIAAAAQRMDRLIKDALNYIKIAHGEFEFTIIDLDQLINDIVRDYPALQQDQASLDIRHPLGRACGNVSLLTQCLSNLLSNAVKFVKPGSPAHVRVWSEPGADNRLRVVVEDEGIGIPQDSKDRIWGLFQRLHHERTYPGTGIGLSIARRAVERMLGRIDVESVPGQGSRFWVELPTGKV